MRLTSKYGYIGENKKLVVGRGYVSQFNVTECTNKLGQLEDIEDELGIDLVTFLKGIDPDTCFMQITKDKEFYLCGDAYYGNYSKEELLKFIQKLLFMYWALTKEELSNGNS